MFAAAPHADDVVAPGALAPTIPGMLALSLSDLLPVLQTAIGPVILISGIGLLLLSMTNRYGRIIDRSRDLLRQLEPDADRRRVMTEIEVLFRRARIVRWSILCTTLSLLLVALLMITLFLSAMLQWQDATPLAELFLAAMLALIAGLVLFLKDLQISLAALRLEVEHARRGGP